METVNISCWSEKSEGANTRETGKGHVDFGVESDTIQPSTPSRSWPASSAIFDFDYFKFIKGNLSRGINTYG